MEINRYDEVSDLSLKILGKSINSIPLFMKGIFMKPSFNGIGYSVTRQIFTIYGHGGLLVHMGILPLTLLYYMPWFHSAPKGTKCYIT